MLYLSVYYLDRLLPSKLSLVSLSEVIRLELLFVVLDVYLENWVEFGPN